MSKDLSDVWGRSLLELSKPLVEEYNRSMVLLSEFDRAYPAPPLNRWQRWRNRTRWWLNENVTWRFARRRSEEWE